MDLERVGRVAFYIGLLISVAAGFVNIGEMGLAALVVLGIIVGALNVTGKEVQKFLLATVALLLVGSTISAIPAIGATLQVILSHFISFVAGAALVIALREVYDITKK